MLSRAASMVSEHQQALFSELVIVSSQFVEGALARHQHGARLGTAAFRALAA